jgi:RND family efflux transporter MFP subunit
MKSTVTSLLLTLAGLAGGGALFLLGQEAPARVSQQPTVLPVHVLQTAPGPVVPTVYATGTVEPAAEIDLVPLVTGEVVWVSPDLRAGARFSKGATIARVDDTAYQSAVAEARTRVARAEQALSLEQGRGEVATLEQSLTGLTPSSDLVLRVPQLRTATAELDAARAGLENAEVNLSHTRLRAPFDAVLVSESIDRGQVVTAGQRVGHLAGTERAHIHLALSASELAQVPVPGFNTDGEGGVATISTNGSTRTGTVVGITGELSATTRTATVLVGVDDPLASPPLLPGAFVTVQLVGSDIADATRLPESALVDGRSVWLVSEQSTLERTDVELVWRGPNQVIVRGDLGTGLVVTQPPAVPLVGQPVTPTEVN